MNVMGLLFDWIEYFIVFGVKIVVVLIVVEEGDFVIVFDYLECMGFVM